MSAAANWLERLAHATDYRDLQEVFGDMASAARGADEPAALVAALDEAIERIRRERARDETELREYEREYDAFKEKEKGVFGWLKRHIPLTETRRQEKEHKADVSDQEAEILADNLVIARAQLLKEALLPVEARRLGADVGDWERRLASHDTVDRLRAFAETVASLQREAKNASAFLEEVGADIDAFAAAKFTSDEDRDRKKADLRAARQELGALQTVLQGKETLRVGSVERLRALIVSDLERSDPAFRTLVARTHGFEETLAHGQGVEASLEALKTALEERAKTRAEFDVVAGKRFELRAEKRRLRDTLSDAETRRVRAEAYAAEGSGRAAASKDAVATAEAAMTAAREAHDANPESSPTAAAALASAKRAYEAAREAHRTLTAPHESARAEAEAALREAQEAGRRLEALEADDQGLGEQEVTLQRALAASRDTLRKLREDARDAVAPYAEALRRLHRPSPVGDIAEDQPERLTAFIEAVQADRTALAEDLASDRRKVESAWARRSQELLGDPLASEVF